MKAFLITAIIGIMAFPFGQNVTPVVTHSALPATSIATEASAQIAVAAPVGRVRLSNIEPDWFDTPRYSLLARGLTESPAFMYHNTTYLDEAWRFVPTGLSGPLEDTYQIQNQNSGLCLVVRGTANNGAVQSACGKQWKDQLWYVYKQGVTGYYQFVNANSGKCLISGAYPDRAYQADCNASPPSPRSIWWNVRSF